MRAGVIIDLENAYLRPFSASATRRGKPCVLMWYPVALMQLAGVQYDPERPADGPTLWIDSQDHSFEICTEETLNSKKEKADGQEQLLGGKDIEGIVKRAVREAMAAAAAD